jgi:hypothetical protein
MQSNEKKYMAEEPSQDMQELRLILLKIKICQVQGDSGRAGLRGSARKDGLKLFFKQLSARRFAKARTKTLYCLRSKIYMRNAYWLSG